MLFSSTIFLFGFLPAVLLFYYGILLRSPKGENRKLLNGILLVASLLFYAWGEPRFVLIMLASIGANWYFGRSVLKRPLLLPLAVVFNIAILFVFKYLNFSADIFTALFNKTLTIPLIELPIGISFFTFQALSYVVDVKRGHGKALSNPLDVGLYISFFPQLIAGPIVRYETIANQLQFREENSGMFNEGVKRFVVGLAKKIVIANTAAVAADSVFSMPTAEVSIATAWLGVIGYTIQIYYDFSGYSDMAIGLGKMFGFNFLENFNYPYVATSISDFWRRWHISLGTWFKDYLYFPLGGNRVSTGRLFFNLFVVWLFTGLWHGANMTFIVWGLLYYALIAFEKLTSFEKRGIPTALRWSYTMLFVMVGWVFFRADSLPHAVAYLRNLTPLNPVGLSDVYTVKTFVESSEGFLLGVLFASPVLLRLAQQRLPLKAYTQMREVALIVLALVAALYVVNGGYNPFIYFNF